MEEVIVVTKHAARLNPLLSEAGFSTSARCTWSRCALVVLILF